MRQGKIIIGTRGSQLSLVQTTLVKNLLQHHIPKTKIEITTISTKGDKNMKPIPLDTIGKGWFTKEIDQQMLDGKIHIAVHSLKDLLDTLTNGLTIAAIPKREDAREALVTNNGKTLKQLRKGAVIGTDSLRRKIQILQIRPDLEVKSVRGNVNKRLEKLDAGEYDGLFLAVAGLKRLGLAERITEYFDATEFIPSPGQGALAVTCNINNTSLVETLGNLNHEKSVIAVTAERAFSAATGGGCSMPVGAYAVSKNKSLMLYGMIGSEDGKTMLKGSMEGTINDPVGLAEKLAKKLLQEAADWFQLKNVSLKKYIVTTRPEEEKDFKKEVKKLGLETINFAVTKQTANLSDTQIKKSLSDSAEYDWILFTSSNGVTFFCDALKKAKISLSTLGNIKIATVGPKTTETAKEYGLQTAFTPKIYTSEELAKTLPDAKGKTLLLPRSAIGNPALKKLLEKRGAQVTDIPIYTTTTQKVALDRVWKLIEEKQLVCLTFTSPSSIHGFIENAAAKANIMKNIPVCTIGKSTTKAAKESGFKNIYTADIQTTAGIITKIKESIL